MVARVAFLIGLVAEAVALIGSVTESTNALLNLLTIVLLVVAAVPIVRSRRKDAAIADLKLSEERLERQLVGAQTRADEEKLRADQAENRVHHLTGQIETLRQYAAPEAFQEIVAALGRLDGVMATAIHEQGELIMQASALVAGQTPLLEQLAKDLSRLADRLGASGERPAQLP